MGRQFESAQGYGFLLLIYQAVEYDDNSRLVPAVVVSGQRLAAVAISRRRVILVPYPGRNSCQFFITDRHGGHQPEPADRSPAEFALCGRGGLHEIDHGGNSGVTCSKSASVTCRDTLDGWSCRSRWLHGMADTAVPFVDLSGVDGICCRLTRRGCRCGNATQGQDEKDDGKSGWLFHE